MSVARVRATQRIISEKSTLFPTEKISIFKKIAVNGDFFVWTNSHLQTSYNWHLKAKKERNRILKKDIYLDDYDDDIEYG